MNIIFKKSFEKQLISLGCDIKDKFKIRLGIFYINKQDPILNTHKLTGKLTGYKSINISGDVRAIFRQEGDDVIFVMIGTHSQLYG